ncbi:hypothetical protein [Microbacterium sp. GCS4]|uniref:hypothetical protein n=1 Tax=Microbacterium sp. GCS4 TaxID=1692239 RepID=UPI00128F381D|nr:hypothetical protein [Microbacterium sp. GCS4]
MNVHPRPADEGLVPSAERAGDAVEVRALVLVRPCAPSPLFALGPHGPAPAAVAKVTMPGDGEAHEFGATSTVSDGDEGKRSEDQHERHERGEGFDVVNHGGGSLG